MNAKPKVQVHTLKKIKIQYTMTHQIQQNVKQNMKNQQVNLQELFA